MGLDRSQISRLGLGLDPLKSATWKPLVSGDENDRLVHTFWSIAELDVNMGKSVNYISSAVLYVPILP